MDYVAFYHHLTGQCRRAFRRHPPNTSGSGGSLWRDGLWETIATFLLLGALFGIVNAVIAPVIKVLAFPLYIITFGLISFVINGAMLLLAAWLSRLIGVEVLSIDGFTQEGLAIESLGWAILAAIVMAVSSFITRFILKILKIR